LEQALIILAITYFRPKDYHRPDGLSF